MKRIIFVLILCLFGAACSPNGSASTEESEAAQIAAVDRAIAVLAEELNVEPELVQPIKVEDAEWQDSCLGLGQANESCLQAITPGYRITLEVAGIQYIYRTDVEGVEVRLEGITE